MNCQEGPSKVEAVDYGYGDAAPDRGTTVEAVDYGYGDAAPDRGTTSQVDMDIDAERDQQAVSQPRVSRRSSMKQGGSSRRASIGYTGEIDVNLPGKRHPVRRRMSITFHEYDQVQEVEPVSSLADEPEKLWFQAEEYDMIRQKAIFLTELAANGGQKLIAEKKLCTRGLESHIDRDNVYQQQYFAWKSVFLEQHHQRNTGVFDDETVGTIYQLVTMPSQAIAVERAQQDTADIENYTRTTRMMMRRLSM
jgi:hypothetical protein